ncbi:hypothetical protein FPF71_15315 [Algibacter amylolyticus]|uniref:Toxin-antitoxin system YwqK family antitoxin n=1 Tax=Algibacter amylolyticus TaxID=1608400 RepID=A0A5M7B2V9_9FLAO|nr:hypothetical protein [Algibacter amylolyticus]KAA5821874.1 hypothetical protein F2B50_15315 [Algibacter amylolyticus]MBB5269328.1 hypothetical protein [Algibacter amylolyticus]TSJ73158.1 hypothetical protein FPF71_15315 [Algibacter amylolyticus]
MKGVFTIIISFLIVHFSNAQHTARFLEFIKDLEVVSCEADTTFYKNGKVRRISCRTTYEYNSDNYSVGTGRIVQYYKNGHIANEYCLDNYGNIKRIEIFNRKGNKVEDYLTTEIDSNAKSLDEFLESHDHISYKTFSQFYRFSKKMETYFLYKEGQIVNGNKNGVWTTYYDNGEMKKEKKY